jgi:hypothetical protein
MPGSTFASAIALAAMTESPMAVTCPPAILRRMSAGAGMAAAPARCRATLACVAAVRCCAAWARVAALMRSPLLTCLARPDDA